MISSKSNEQVKLLASLKNKKYREKHSKYIIEGIKLIGEMIDSGGFSHSEFIVYSKELLSEANGGSELLDKILKSNIETMEVSQDVFKYISDTLTPQGVLAVKNIQKITQKEKLEQIMGITKKNGSFLILDKVSDTGNFGTIIRSAVSFGIDCILCIDGTVDLYNSKVVRSTMGAIEKIKIFYISEDEYIKIVKLLVNNEYEIVGTSLEAKKFLNELDYSKNIVFVMGNEANGLSQSVCKLCTDYVKIKMEDKQESLNVAIATGICLYSRYI